MLLKEIENKISELIATKPIDSVAVKDNLVDYMMKLSQDQLATIDVGGDTDKIYGDPVITSLAIDAIRALKNNIPGKRRRANLFAEVLQAYLDHGRVAFQKWPVDTMLGKFRAIKDGLLDPQALEEVVTLFPDNLVTEMKNLVGYKLFIDDSDKANDNYTYIFASDTNDDMFIYYNRRGNIGKVRVNKFNGNVETELQELSKISFSKKNFSYSYELYVDGELVDNSNDINYIVEQMRSKWYPIYNRVIKRTDSVGVVDTFNPANDDGEVLESWYKDEGIEQPERLRYSKKNFSDDYTFENALYDWNFYSVVLGEDFKDTNNHIGYYQLLTINRLLQEQLSDDVKSEFTSKVKNLMEYFEHGGINCKDELDSIQKLLIDYYNIDHDFDQLEVSELIDQLNQEWGDRGHDYVDYSKKSKKDFGKNPDITNEKSFRDYAHNIMKNAHGDDYSEEFTDKVVDDLIRDNPDASWGELIGRLTSGLGNKGKNFSEESDIIYGLGDFMHEDDKSIEFLPEYDLDYEDINEALDAAKLIASEIEDGIQVLVVEASLSGSNYVASVSSTDDEVKRYENDEEFMKEWKIEPELVGD